jgi:hypothetical protein
MTDPVRAAAEALVHHVETHPFAAKGMGPPHHQDWERLQEMTDALRQALRAPPQGDAPRRAESIERVLTAGRRAVDLFHADDDEIADWMDAIEKEWHASVAALRSLAAPAPQGDAAPGECFADPDAANLAYDDLRRQRDFWHDECGKETRRALDAESRLRALAASSPRPEAAPADAGVPTEVASLVYALANAACAQGSRPCEETVQAKRVALTDLLDALRAPPRPEAQDVRQAALEEAAKAITPRAATSNVYDDDPGDFYPYLGEERYSLLLRAASRIRALADAPAPDVDPERSKT